MADSKSAINELKNSKDKLATLSKMNIKNPLIELLDNDGAISTIKNKDGVIQALDYRKSFDEKAIMGTLKKLEELGPKLSSLKTIKAYKIFASVANVLITAGVMGVLQPKINIWMRKHLNNGDNRNPAIVEQERKMALNNA